MFYDIAIHLMRRKDFSSLEKDKDEDKEEERRRKHETRVWGGGEVGEKTSGRHFHGTKHCSFQIRYWKYFNSSYLFVLNALILVF